LIENQITHPASPSSEIAEDKLKMEMLRSTSVQSSTNCTSK